MNNQPPSRLLTTSARVHPAYLPYLHNAASRSKGKSLKWLPPLAAAVTAGYAVTTYRNATTNSAGQLSTTPLLASSEHAEAERRRREASMADAYGDRGSLAELERAMALYEAQQGQGQQQGR